MRFNDNLLFADMFCFVLKRAVMCSLSLILFSIYIREISKLQDGKLGHFSSRVKITCILRIIYLQHVFVLKRAAMCS
jgi:hypothetical protein